MWTSRAVVGPLALLTVAAVIAACGDRAASADAGPGGQRVADASAGGSGASGVLTSNGNRRPSEIEGREPTVDIAPRGDPDAYAAAMMRGDAMLYSGRFEAARVAFLAAMELRPQSMSPALGAVRSMGIEGHAEARQSIAQRIRKKISAYGERPQTVGAGYLLGARLGLALGEPGEALDQARLAVQHMPDLGVAWRVLGESAMAAELWGEAVESLQTALALGLQAEAGSWERMADALDELGELDAALEAAEQAIRSTGEDTHALRRRLNLLASILKHRGDLEEASRVLDEARLLGPEDPAVLHNLGALAEARRRPDEALQHYRTATAETPVPTTLWRMGKLLLQRDRPNEALTAFTAAAGQLDRWSWPSSTRWLPAYEVGKLYARAKRFKAATGWFEDALREALTAEATREIVSWLAFVKTQTLDEEE